MDLYLPDLPPDAWPTLDPPDFFSRDPHIIEERLIKRYQEISGKTLYPAQPERLMINIMAYELALLRIEAEGAARGNLLRYAHGSRLDMIGERLDTQRLTPASARTRIRFTLADQLAFPVAIPAGSRVATADQLYSFATENKALIEAGSSYIDVIAVAEQPGADANGLVAGQIATLIDAIPYIATVSNTTQSNSGADREDDARYRIRIRTAPRRFSTAGPGSAYAWHVLSASQTITDVAVRGPEDGLQPGQVEIHPLTKTGAPSLELKALVTATIKANGKIRPLTDQVTVRDPVRVAFTIAATITPYATEDANAVLKAVHTALTDYGKDQRRQLGADIVRSQMIMAAQVPGLYDITLTEPISDKVLARHAWADCTRITLTLAQPVEG